MDLQNAYYNDRMNEVLNERILSGGALRKRPRRSGSKTSRPKRRSVSKRRGGSKSRKVVRRTRRPRKRAGSKRRGGVLIGAGSRRRMLKPARGRRGHGVRPMGRRRPMAGTMAGGRHKRALTPYNKFVSKEMRKGYTMAEAAKKWRNRGRGSGGARKVHRRKRVSGSKTSRPRRRVARRKY